MKSVGYLASQEGADSDHVLAFIDFDENRLFRGIINRPVAAHSREFMLAQSDKVQAFLKELVAWDCGCRNVARIAFIVYVRYAGAMVN